MMEEDCLPMGNIEMSFFDPDDNFKMDIGEPHKDHGPTVIFTAARHPSRQPYYGSYFQDQT